MAAKEYRWFADSGHAWLEVPIADVRTAGVLERISHYSYLRHGEKLGTLYLEEDCDAPLFIAAAGLGDEARGYAEVYTDGESRIRTLPRWEGGETQ